VEFDSSYKAVSLEEKPLHPRSHYAIPGLYFYDDQVVNYAKSLKPSPRGEIEITDLNKMYLESGKLNVQPMGRGIAWLDAGTHESLLQAANFIEAVEERQGIMISCPEEVAYRMGFITKEKLIEAIKFFQNNTYGKYLQRLMEEEL
jgi:glucose-1-phosphate thymidylyltransferase